MACVECENLIPDYLEKQLPAEAQSRVAAHLAQCTACRTFARQLEQLDAALVRGVKAPALPPDFRARLRQRIQTVPVWSEAERAERRRRLQAEYEAGLARLRPFPLSLRRMRQGLVLAALLVFLGWLGWLVPANWEDLLARLVPAGLDQDLSIAVAVALIFVAMGLAANAFRRQLRRVLLLA
ncbi:MAG: zf-HC2 domain-containing protein [Verrucomicrobia bacterium]|nr:zf-HC2 domain-containing protein [Verrucomicrobiota bacterium]